MLFFALSISILPSFLLKSFFFLSLSIS
jgi:hypothetical protein